MVAWCNKCQRYVNQHCDTCGENFGVLVCEKYACGGTMMCPLCGMKELSIKKEAGPDPYDFKGKTREERIAEKTGAPAAGALESSCPMCRFQIESTWKFCPNCGVKFSK